MPRWWHQRRDLVLGITLGIVIGIAVVALFVFVFSEKAVDAPSIDGSQPSTTTPVVTGPVPSGDRTQPPGGGP